MPVLETQTGHASGAAATAARRCALGRLAVAVAVFVYCWKQISDATTWFFVWDAPRIAADIWTRAVPPRWEYISQLWVPIWDTLNMATLGTLILRCPRGAGRVPGGAQHHAVALFIRPIALLIIVSTRSINSLIWALLLIAIIGPGVFAGVIAIAIRSIGFCAKLLYEAIEEIDHSQVEAITATGASRWQVMAYGIVPQIMPAFAGHRRVPMGHQHPRKHRAGPCRRGRESACSCNPRSNVLAWPQVSLILIVILVRRD
jgi:phosphonate transport system permease protein